MDYLDRLIGKDVTIELRELGRETPPRKVEGVLLGYDAHYLVMNVPQRTSRDESVYKLRLFNHDTVFEISKTY